jgi:site-specific DNA recombinase
MLNEAKRRLRCAIYTRKSSEEGLEQSFNSLEAQREACGAYIVSQRHEGWRAVSAVYDDGGYSGGTIERPALQRLLHDVEAQKIDVVVVYKVDRLTRSLSDFVKIVEVFDKLQVSFVSVTQQFNTTTSMGRLTLNVLLSFAQFEREVTGERIRDKIAASKRKGMWMGGKVPPGYALSDRKLIVNSGEAERVREIYRQYLKCGCVSKLRAHLDSNGLATETRTHGSGNKSGRASYSRGALYRILQNRLYLGEIPHKGNVYPGQHDGIVPRDLWEKVQARLRENDNAHRTGSRALEPSLLVGLLHDEEGNRFTPSHTVKSGKRYRYYVLRTSEPDAERKAGSHRSIPAAELENVVRSALQSLFKSPEKLANALGRHGANAERTQGMNATLDKTSRELSSHSPAQLRALIQALVSRIVVRNESLDLMIRRQALAKLAGQKVRRERAPDAYFPLTVNIRFAHRGRETCLILTGDSEQQPARPSLPLIKAVARAHDWLERILAGNLTQRSIASMTELDERYVSRILQCACLAPDIVESVLDGRQPPNLAIDDLVSGLPLGWAAQRQKLGFAPR